jgi:peptide/nickel transport system ATP-binding protein
MLTLHGISKTYPNGTRALREASFSLGKGEVLGLVGESGSGKSTLARLVCAFEDMQEGNIRLDGLSYGELTGRSRRDIRRRVQMVFQDAAGSLDPRRTVFQAIEEPLRNFNREQCRRRKLTRLVLRDEAAALLDATGLERTHGKRYPHELSGGERQRVVIARALAADPDYLICDEPVSSLDGETRERILGILAALVAERQLGCLFITHDVILAVRMCRKVLVMRDGSIVDIVAAGDLSGIEDEGSLRNAYTRSLAASAGEGTASC